LSVPIQLEIIAVRPERRNQVSPFVDEVQAGAMDRAVSSTPMAQHLAASFVMLPRISHSGSITFHRANVKTQLGLRAFKVGSLLPGPTA
jgi:hypothetical protein